MSQAILSRTISLGYLKRKGYPGQRKKVRSIEEWQREIEEVRIGEINKDTILKSRSCILTLRLLKLCLKTRFNKKT